MNSKATENHSSTLGIEYQEFLPVRLISLFIQAEHERLQNAGECYDVDAWEVWAMDIVPRLIAQSLQAVDLDDLRRYAPNFLTSLIWNPEAISLSDTALKLAILEAISS